MTSYKKLASYVSSLIKRKKTPSSDNVQDRIENPQINENNISELVSDAMIRWTSEGEINDSELVRQIFHLLHRQYNSVEEVSLDLV